MLIAVLSGFIVAAALAVTGRFMKGRLSILLSLLPVSLLAYFLSFVPRLASGERLFFSFAWVPSMGVNLDFYLDGLSLLFALLITGIGSLVFIYASSYLRNHKYLDRFYGYLSMFMASMLGLVLSDNAMSLFVFWELTSITSFFLIGFNNDNLGSRKSALVALAVTGGGGFVLMAGFLLMGAASGTYSIQAMVAGNALLKDHALYGLMLVCLLGGAFTKSAQFPFHFWLPGAMKAPTPVSAYLHSATMVKAGVYLLARFTPVLGATPEWNTTLTIVGGITMLYAAFHAIFRTDLKSVLAYSTISALGMLVFLLGIGTHHAFMAAAVFILVHALYKAGLFLVAGIIDHETNTRDVTKLSGLGPVMMPLFIAGLLAALSNAGVPLTFGFLGKDLIYEATLATGSLAVFLTTAVVVTNALLLYAGLLAGVKPFTGKPNEAHAKVHLPSPTMWVPPLLLGVGGMLFGTLPGLVDQAIVRPVVLALHGSAVDVPLKIWHGFNLVLLLSGVTLSAGLLLYVVKKPSSRGLEWLSRLDIISPQSIVTKIADGLLALSAWFTRTLQNGFLRFYVSVIVLFLSVLLGYRLFSGIDIYIDPCQLEQLTVYETVVASIMFVAILKTMFTASRLTALAAMGVVGYCICLLFVFYGAPDLAMTQFSVDTLTVVLFVLVMFRLPSFLRFANAAQQIRD
ncbi:MAG TPA: proton-conducting transporter membrane subunit, partial [Chitinophagales bacterium]|nr:proton-conducting transporter membrane subunit [Chitinophagales bacterium]